MYSIYIASVYINCLLTIQFYTLCGIISLLSLLRYCNYKMREELSNSRYVILKIYYKSDKLISKGRAQGIACVLHSKFIVKNRIVPKVRWFTFEQIHSCILHMRRTNVTIRGFKKFRSKMKKWRKVWYGDLFGTGNCLLRSFNIPYPVSFKSQTFNRYYKK